ncbi:MAG: hypothetical protein J6X44_09015, partial [Thermoguttaceae bacterium]|nr:hypothetical protein [Thermoguttaceae bacterium]
MTSKETTKWSSKDSVFVRLFNDEKYVFQLYKDLHPEDKDVKIEDINVRTIKSVVVNTLINDLGFTVGDRLVVLVEAQSVWNKNIPLRMLYYYSETCKRYLAETKQSEHTESAVKLPKPEFYVVYTGKKEVPDAISFKEIFFGGDAPIDLEVCVLKKVDEKIYGQYIGFCKVYDEQREKYGNDVKCARETIRICIEKGYLVPFLQAHKQEVITMLDELFDEEALREAYDLARERENLEQGREQGLEQGTL